jgi:hypothetical protein
MTIPRPGTSMCAKATRTVLPSGAMSCAQRRGLSPPERRERLVREQI